jgi:type IV pilus assembly protein PilO
MALTLEGKPAWIGLLIGLALAAIIIGAVQYEFIRDIDNGIKAADAKIKDLDTKIQQGRAAQRTLPQFEEEVRRLKAELDKLRRILPSTRNTEEIIKKIKSLVDTGDFVLHRLTFPKIAPPKEGGEPYAEWPINVSVDGRYHNLAILFNHLSNFSRIMNVEQITISALPQQTERTITSEFVAKTFVYVEPKETTDTTGTAAPAGKKP